MAALVTLLAAWLLPVAVVAFDSGGKPLRTAEVTAVAGVRQAVLWSAGGLIAITALFFTFRRDQVARNRADLDRDANFTARYTQAVEQLGHPESIAIRLGGVFALERIGYDSARDWQTIVDVLAAILREPLAFELDDDGDERKELPGDRAVAALALGRLTQRPPASGKVPNRVDLHGAALRRARLSNANLKGANFKDAHLVEARLDGANLTRASFVNADLRGANFIGAYLDGANLVEVNLTGAYLEGAALEGAFLVDAVMRRADLRGATLAGAFLTGADVSGADLTGVDLTDVVLTGVIHDRDTKWPAGESVPGAIEDRRNEES